MNGREVLVRRLPYKSAGHILQFRIACSDLVGARAEIFQRILSALERSFEGVMVNEELDEKGFAEIRVLNGLEIPAIVAIMSNSVGVTQIE